MSFGAIFGVVAALAFVLALLALTVWGLKRLGLARLGGGPGARLPMEIVQRVSVGPKTSIAVVRVGETVMAVSVGDGGVRPLFEVSDGDRQAVLASSRIAAPHASGSVAQQAIDTVLTRRTTEGTAMPAPVPVVPIYTPPSPEPRRSVATPRQQALRSALVHDASARIDALLTPPDGSVPVTVSARLAPEGRGLAEFQSVLRMAMSGATRLACLALAVLLSAATVPAVAQGAPQAATPQAAVPQGATTQPAAPAVGASPTAAPQPAATTRPPLAPRVPSGPPARDTK
ncbi:MAG: flagellar biosynthetic protein FliO, partial [Gemmatimonadaceae bacterium]|nr:flagellar biosynthetic protein FliO [Gemmatimonadaceae bacterium]